MEITGYITRLIAPEGSFGERIFFRPDQGQDDTIRQLDGKHKAGYGAEIIVAAPIARRKIGEAIKVALRDGELVVV